MLKGFRLDSKETLDKILQKAKEHRLLMLRAGRNTLRILPTLTISNEEIDKGFDRFNEALLEV